MDRTGATAALSTSAPALAPAEVQALVRRLYGIGGSVQPLAGERDHGKRSYPLGLIATPRNRG